MYYISFDVSKNKLDIALTNLRTRTEYFTIENNEKAIEEWLNTTPLPKKFIMGCEATGTYHVVLARTCAARGYIFKLLNPILTKQFTRATIRKQKTDRSDSLVIAKLLAQGEGLRFVWNQEIEAGKSAHRLARRIGTYAVGMQLLRHSLATAQADNSLLQDLDDTIAAMQKRKLVHEKTLQTICGNHPDVLLLRSIAGIGVKLAPVIWSEIGDIGKFNGPKQLVAYAGLDPKIRRSGGTLNSQGKLTKRGSPHLRRALFLAANRARQFDPELKAYYLKKRSEGKKYTVAICATSRKLANRIYAVWSRRTPYIIQTKVEIQNVENKLIETCC